MWVWYRYDVWMFADEWKIKRKTRTNFTSEFDGTPENPPTEEIVRSYFGFDDYMIIRIGDDYSDRIEVCFPSGEPMGRFEFDHKE